MNTLNPTIAAAQGAFLAISSRLVGASFRVLETYNPTLQESKSLSDSQSVMKREATAIALAWLFALGGNTLLQPLVERKKLGRLTAVFCSTVLGTAIAESIGRLVAYRKQALTSSTHMQEALKPSAFSTTVSGIRRYSLVSPAVFTCFQTLEKAV